MCMSGPPYGIPITPDVQELLPADIVKTWEKFDAWMQENPQTAETIHKADIPGEIWDAMLKVLPTPIPGYEGKTLADSCYWVCVLENLDERPAGF